MDRYGRRLQQEEEEEEELELRGLEAAREKAWRLQEADCCALTLHTVYMRAPALKPSGGKASHLTWDCAGDRT
eukprot:3039606-Pyramimonas_sp.AAC.1